MHDAATCRCHELYNDLKTTVDKIMVTALINNKKSKDEEASGVWRFHPFAVHATAEFRPSARLSIAVLKSRTVEIAVAMRSTSFQKRWWRNPSEW